MTLFLFDIDGTLVRCGGAGRWAMGLAFHQVFGVEDAFARVDFRGNVDGRILADQLARWGWPRDDARIGPFMDAYGEALRRGLSPPLAPDQVRCPGVPAILDRLEGSPLGLVTGNWEMGARIKLEAFGLSGRFTVGAFGDDGDRRDLLVPVAVRRARARGLDTERVVMIGDTPEDVGAARAAGAVAVAVQTGWSPLEELQAAAPDLLLPDLEEGADALVALAT